MNAERLLAHFERIADLPDAVDRLRRLILDSAVRGRLAAQIAGEEPASKLRERIKRARTHLIREGPQRQSSTEVEQPRLKVPFEPPQTWVLTTLGEISTKTGSGSTPRGGKQVYKSGGVPFLRSQNVYNDGLRLEGVAYIDDRTHSAMDGTKVMPGDLLLNITGASIGRCCIVPDTLTDANVSQHVAIIRLALPELVAFIHTAVLSPYFQFFVLSEQTGAGRGGLPKNRMDRIPIALPPVAEQHRIVDRVSELMTVCDQVESARVEREAKRERLTMACFARLRTPGSDPARFAADARFTLNILPTLTARRDQIQQLRQTIVNLAVRGQLIQQDSRDEPVVNLIERTRSAKGERERGAVAGRTHKRAEFSEKQDPFRIPSTWAWVGLEDLAQLITKGSSPKWQGVSYVDADGGLLFITSENVGRYKILKLDDLKYVESRFRKIEPRSMLKSGDVLINLVGASIGRTALYDLQHEANINQAVALVRLVEMQDGVCVDYLLHYLNSTSAVQLMLTSRVTTAQPNMSLTDVRVFPVPLPPLAEQRRIVAKVNELTLLCDRLEASLSNAETTRSRLLEALLADALAPIGSEIQAAQ